MRRGISLVVLMLLVGLQACGMSQEALKFPEAQRAFFALNEKCRRDHSNGANDIQRSRAFNQCNQSRARVGRSIEGWVAKIAEISTDQGGKVASLTLRTGIDGFDMSFSTVGTALADLDKTTLITPDSYLFDVLAEMKEGELVSFDAEFLPHPDAARGIWEASLTERGSMESPDFIVKFTGIRPYGSPGEVVHRQKIIESNMPAKEAGEDSSVAGAPPTELSDVPSSEPTTSASFDCHLARTETENAICTNATLARVDAYTAEMYRCLREMPASNPDDLQERQRAWLIERDLCSGDVSCLRAVYGRIAEAYMELSGFDQCQSRVTSAL